MDLIRQDSDFFRLREDMNRLFDYALGRISGRPDYWHPAVDVYQSDDEVVVKAELPGIDPADVDLTISSDSLSLKGEVKEESEINRDGFFRSERRYGSFTRTVPLPAEVKAEEARASYENGILTVRVPKTERARKRSIKIDINPN